mmetsp:Transcript_9860/g.30117  ORF Transcript_9860/g.30117 Transcript_9860/m.30117 type:complete len:105 (+) Transcript_9860:167-481(+)
MSTGRNEELSGELETTLRELTRECLRAQPRDLGRFCLDHFSSSQSTQGSQLVEPGVRGDASDRSDFLSNMERLLADLTCECLKERPGNVKEFCKQYFQSLVNKS